jgi:cysteine sulfinate desulfinase/cysteine desulfurase-like protein
MGVDEKESKSAIRVSVSYDQPKEDIEKFLEILEKIRPKL